MKFLFQRFGHIQDAVGLFGLGLFQDKRGLAALTPVREGVVDLLGVELFQSVLVGSLHGLADRDGATPIGGIKVQITRLQAENFALTERKDHAHVHRQMQGRVLDGLQCCQHGFLVPDGAFLDVDLGCITGQGNLVDQVPFHRIGERRFQQRVDFVDRGAGQQPLLLLLGQILLDTLHILPAGGLGKGGVELLDVVGAQLLHLPFTDIWHDQVLHHRYGLGVGLGGPFVLGRLDRNPFVQHLLHRHGVGDKECAVQQFFLDRDLSLLRLLFGLETLPSLAGLAGMVFVLVTDGVGISALHNRCHRLPPSDRRKPVVEALLVYPDTGADAQHPKILRGVAQVVRSARRNRQKLGDFLHPVNKRFVLGCFGLVRRFNGRGFRRFHCNRVRVLLQELIRIIFGFHSFGHVRPIHIHRQTSNSL